MEGDYGEGDKLITVAISIHALRVEGDDFHELISTLRAVISIHALRVEGDLRRASTEVSS